MTGFIEGQRLRLCIRERICSTLFSSSGFYNIECKLCIKSGSRLCWRWDGMGRKLDIKAQHGGFSLCNDRSR
jgi:hypothetical protein